ncbi:metal tolerance protein 4-like [Papaver somniferum]|uniref:metal tolerance protein 4-like n=1 Tax=Papaver somniferum TaxID=3469 RepID=UPI000E6F95E5|nr:metal tolerance protein 4-like [Papaver somniferum]
MKREDSVKYPIGKSRVGPVGLTISATMMATLGLQVLIESGKKLLLNEEPLKMDWSQLVWLYSIMLSASAVKLSLWFYCRSSPSEIVRACAKDHYFDVMTNIIGLIAAVLGDRFYWWIDPVGAIILAIYTISIWSGVVMENAVSLIGQSAAPDVLEKLTNLATGHHHLIKRVERIQAYTIGGLFVEVDIELLEDLPLEVGRDIGLSLQVEIEKLTEVERAFVRTLIFRTEPAGTSTSISCALQRD